jgi:cyclohexadienyl dehydratase
MGKNIVHLIAVIAGLSPVIWGAHSAQAQGASRLDRLQEQKELRVCIWPDYYSISYRNPRTGALQGVDIDMARHFAADLGVALRFIDSSFRTLIDDLLNDRCDISMHGIGVTPARQEKLAFSSPHLRGGVYAITGKNHPSVKTWADIDREGVVVAAQAGTYMEPVMRSTLKKAELLVVQSPEAREQEVASGRADLFVTDYPYSRKMLAIHDWARLLTPPAPLAPIPYAYATAPGDSAWLTAVNDFIARAKKDGRLAKAAADNDLSAIVVLD